MRKVFYLTILLIGFYSIFPSMPEAKQLVGWLENVIIFPENIAIRAKLDTGAKNSSVNALNTSRFMFKGEEWVRFEVMNYKGKRLKFKRKIHRIARVKNAGEETEERLAVRLEICMGKVYKEVEVNLADRSNMNYQMIIGRSFMDQDLILDPSEKYLTKPDCPEALKK